jgi:hypothetical protein
MNKPKIRRIVNKTIEHAPEIITCTAAAIAISILAYNQHKYGSRLFFELPDGQRHRMEKFGGAVVYEYEGNKYQLHIIP